MYRGSERSLSASIANGHLAGANLAMPTLSEEDRTYQRIGEFVVCFQGIENRLREIGWFILDPGRTQWPPTSLRNLTNEKLVDRVHALFVDALPRCKLPAELETDLKDSFLLAVAAMHKLRRDRNRLLHSAFIELKAGGELVGMLRSDPKLDIDEDGSLLTLAEN